MNIYFMLILIYFMIIKKFIEKIIKDNKYDNEYYQKQSVTIMAQLKRGIMDIKCEKQLKKFKQLNNKFNEC